MSFLQQISCQRRELVVAALNGSVRITMATGHGKPLVFNATLDEKAREAAAKNSDLFYELLGINKRELQKKRKARRDRRNQWLPFSQQVFESVNELMVVDAVDMRWRWVSIRKLVSWERTA